MIVDTHDPKLEPRTWWYNFYCYVYDLDPGLGETLDLELKKYYVMFMLRWS